MDPRPKRVKLSEPNRRLGNIVANLSHEIWLDIFQHLDIISVLRCRRVSRRWNTLLRDESIQPTVAVLDEKECRKYNGYSWYNSDNRQPDFYERIFRRLTKNPLWKSVDRLILIGDYDFHQIATAEPHTGARPVSLSDIWRGFASFSRYRELAGDGFDSDFDSDYENIKWVRKTLGRNLSVEIRQMALSWRQIYSFLLWCDYRLQITNVSLVLKVYFTGLPSFEVPISSVTLEKGGDLECLGDTFDVPLKNRSYSGHVAVPIAEVIRDYLQRLELAPLEELKEKFRILLKGRKNCRIRVEIDDLFADPHEYLPDGATCRECCQRFFTKNKTISKFQNYVLMYYAMPRNFYVLADDERNGRISRHDR